jgi:polysaccharide export outer membrane protein
MAWICTLAQNQKSFGSFLQKRTFFLASCWIAFFETIWQQLAMPRGFLPMLLGVLLAGCTTVPDDLPPAPPVPAAPAAYRVQVGDVLGIRLYLAPELNEDVTVRPDGLVGTTLAQSVPAAGRLPAEIAADLRRIYAGELKTPDLTVEVKTPSPARVFVAGEVVFPGEYDSTGAPLTLLQAVARAGGLRPTGDPSHVFVVRHAPGDRAVVYAAANRAAATGTAPAADITLAPFDIVYVPKSGVSQVYLWFNQHFQQFVPVSWGFSYNVNPYVNNTK